MLPVQRDRRPRSPARARCACGSRVSGVNPTDWKSRAGATGRPAVDFQVPNQDGAGVIDAVGEGVEESARRRARVGLLRRLAAPVGDRGAVHGRARPRRPCRCPRRVRRARRVARHPGADRVPLPARRRPGRAAARCSWPAARARSATRRSSSRACARRARRRHGLGRGEGRAGAAGRRATRRQLPRRRRGRADPRGGVPGGSTASSRSRSAANLELDLAVAARARRRSRPTPPTGDAPQIPIRRLMAANLVLRFVLVYMIPRAALRGRGRRRQPGGRGRRADAAAAAPLRARGHRRGPRRGRGGAVGKVVIDVG